jgi:hypothetical protein
MAIEKGNSIAMKILGKYYHYIEKNYDEMKKYYLMAIEKGNCEVKQNLLEYYENKYKDGIYNADINDAIQILDKLEENQLKYKYIDYGFNNLKNIDYHLIGNYSNTIILQLNIFKHINKICNKLNLYNNYNNILLLLYLINKNKLNIPKYLKFNIIYYVVQ